MKVLITGGCGFLGSNLASHALSLGDEVHIYDNLSRVGAVENLNWLQGQGKCTFIHGDIRDSNMVSRAIEKCRPDEIFHLAGQVAMTVSIENPRFDFEVNALGTLNVLEAVRRYVPHATVAYSSTNKVYGDLDRFNYEENDTRYTCMEYPNGFNEQVHMDFSSPYGCSKGAADQYMVDYARCYGLKTVVFRHSSMYGGRQFASFDQGWIGWFCQKAVESKVGSCTSQFTISGTGKQVRDVLHADDMVRLYFSLRDHIEAARGQVYNIGGGLENSLSLLELFSILEDKADVALKYVKLPFRQSDQRVFIADIKKVQEHLLWNPTVCAATGISKMLEWTEDVLAERKTD